MRMKSSLLTVSLTCILFETLSHPPEKYPVLQDTSLIYKISSVTETNGKKTVLEYVFNIRHYVQNMDKSCRGDRNAVPGCGINCGRLCSNYNKGPIECPAICKLNDCDCKPGFVYDEVVKQCVLPTQCTSQCGLNEIVSNCTNSVCRAQNCIQIGQPIACPTLIQDRCLKGCECRDGYFRNQDGICVSRTQCDACGGDLNAVPGCGNNCGRRCSDYNNGTLPCVLVLCSTDLPTCICKPDYVYDDIKRQCIRPQDCSFPCVGPNEVYQAKPPTCLKENCIDFLSNSTCASTASEGSIRILKHNCWCKENYYRNYKGTCVEKDQCFSQVCPEGESLSTCPTLSCDADYCPLTRDYPQTCPHPKQCGRPRCVCRFNRSRDRRTGECIAIFDCPPFECNGLNEEYQPCPLPCSNQNCSDYLNITTCTTIDKSGIVVLCRPKCFCKMGYYRNNNGICVSGSQCLLTSKTNAMAKQTIDVENNTNNARQRFVDGNVKFTTRFLYEVANSKPAQSVIMSPFSVSSLLAQLALYAEGPSYNQLKNVFNLVSKNEIRIAFFNILSAIRTQKNVISDLAQKVYVNFQYQLSDKFRKDSLNFFGAGAENIDFSFPVEAADIINNWVKAKTNNRIIDLVSADMFSAFTRLVLVNAIYFKGTWKIKFDSSNTQKRLFYLNSNETIETDTMYVKDSFRYADSTLLESKIIELDYVGSNYSFVAILPNSIDGLYNLLAKLRNQNVLGNALNSMLKGTVQVYLPKYETRTTTILTEVLKKLNITYIFDSANSGLNGILKQPQDLYCSDAIQKAFILVNEEGSEAAAANAISVRATAALFPQRQEYIFKADHPFVYFIMLKSVNNSYPLFTGVYTGA